MERLVLEVTPHQRRQIKSLAAFSGMTMKDYILGKALPPAKAGALIKGRTQNVKHDETERLMSSPSMASRLARAMKGSRAKRVSFDSIKEVKHALGI